MHSHQSWLQFLTAHTGLRTDLDVNLIGYRIGSGDTSVYDEYPEFSCLRGKSPRITQHEMRCMPDEALVALLAPANEHYGMLVDYRVELMLMDEVVKFLPAAPVRALEIGCGTAVYPLYLLSQGLIQSATALDPSPTMMAQAKRTAETLQIPIELVQGYIQKWEGNGKKYDFVFSLDTLNWIKDWPTAVRMHALRTRKGGRCLMAYGYPASRSLIPVEKILALLPKVGLEVVSAETAELLDAQPRVIITTEKL